MPGYSIFESWPVVLRSILSEDFSVAKALILFDAFSLCPSSAFNYKNINTIIKELSQWRFLFFMVRVYCADFTRKYRLFLKFLDVSGCSYNAFTFFFGGV